MSFQWHQSHQMQLLNLPLVSTYAQSVRHHITALKRAVEQISGQFLQQSSTWAKRNVFDAPSVLFHALYNLYKTIKWVQDELKLTKSSYKI